MVFDATRGTLNLTHTKAEIRKRWLKCEPGLNIEDIAGLEHIAQSTIRAWQYLHKHHNIKHVDTPRQPGD